MHNADFHKSKGFTVTSSFDQSNSQTQTFPDCPGGRNSLYWFVTTNRQEFLLISKADAKETDHGIPPQLGNSSMFAIWQMPSTPLRLTLIIATVSAPRFVIAIQSSQGQMAMPAGWFDDV
jgi:hypothetical protein